MSAAYEELIHNGEITALHIAQDARSSAMLDASTVNEYAAYGMLDNCVMHLLETHPLTTPYSVNKAVRSRYLRQHGSAMAALEHYKL